MLHYLGITDNEGEISKSLENFLFWLIKMTSIVQQKMKLRDLKNIGQTFI